MRKRPKSARYRNLLARGSVIYFERVVRGRRIRISTKTSDWDEAAGFRDLYEKRKGIADRAVPIVALPRFEVFSARYLEEDTSHLAKSTRRDRDSYLRPEGPLLGFFGDFALDAIDPPQIRAWWIEEVERAGRSAKTGRCYLDVLSAVLGFAADLGLIERNPVPLFRETLRRRSRTQQGRAARNASARITPIEDPRDLRRLVEAAHVEGPAASVLVLLLLDGGLRLGEALGLPWGAISWGDHDLDPRRALRIVQSRARGGPVGPTKTGRDRTVALSLRLRRALRALYRSRFEPGPDLLVLPEMDPSNFRRREWRRILKRSQLGHRRLKDLRDTYASQLLTSGIQLGYVSAQLGHSDVSVTARHYARWVGDDVYRQPVVLDLGEVPADLLAKLSESPHRPPTQESGDFVRPRKDELDRAAVWRAGRDSNPRPSGSKPDSASSRRHRKPGTSDTWRTSHGVHSGPNGAKSHHQSHHLGEPEDSEYGSVGGGRRWSISRPARRGSPALASR